MKKYFITLIFALIISPCVSAQWVWLHPRPQNNALLDICFINNNQGLAVGEWGAIIRTTNSGVNWIVNNYSSNYNLQTCCMINGSTGFIGGTLGTILKTTNAGINWTSTSLSVSYTAKKIFFVNVNTGWFLNNSFYKTTNCGIDWLAMPVITNNATINTIFFVNGLTGFAAGTPLNNSRFRIYKTVNGGLNWGRIDFLFNTSIQSLFFTDSLTGYAGGTNGVLARTTDCGNSWTQLFVANTYGSVRTIKFINHNTGYINFTNDTISRVFKTTNAGLNFTLSFLDSTFILSSVSAFGPDVYVCGNKGRLARSSDAGNNWTSNSGNIRADLFTYKFQDEFNAIACGTYGTLIDMYRTTNGGINWVNYASYPELIDSRDFYFCDQFTGYAVGGSSTQTGKSMRTTNGGISWTQLPSIPYRALYTVHFLNGSTGLAGGMQGLIIRTTNAGDNWTIVNTGGPHGNYSIRFLNENIAYYCNSNGDVYKSTNGGINWFISANVGTSINYIQFTDENTGYLGANTGVSKTTNGGYNWFNVKSGGTCPYLQFYNSNTGFASVYNGKVFRTTNGGTNWIDETGFAVPTIYEYNFITSDIVYAAAANLLMKTTNGGILLPVIEFKNESPVVFSLSQNYPNPFNPSTTCLLYTSPSPRD